MLYLNSGDLQTHVYEEVRNAIARSSDDIINNAIAAAVREAKGYLSRFDLIKLFGTDTEAATVTDENLKWHVTSIAVWKLCVLSNVNLNLDVIKILHQDAIDYLKDIQAGKSDPEGWIYKTDDPDSDYNENSQVQYTTNTKRRQHF
jgi:hypothetical protein